MNNMSSEGIGSANYVEKRNWRREYNTEARREGDVYFTPESIEDAVPDKINGDPVLKIHFAQAPNGQVILLAITETTIYRWFGSLNGRVYEVGVYEEGIYETELNSWVNINPAGYVFTPSGRCWEAETVNGITFLNNGVDLPVTYCAFEPRAKPAYELREQCIARVETIMKTNGIILCMDVTSIDRSKFDEWMNGDNPYGAYSDPSEQRRQWRIIHSPVGDPRLWGTTGKGTMTVGSKSLVLDTPMRSIKKGDEIVVEGAGPFGSNLTTLVSSVIDDKNFITLFPAQTAVFSRPVHRCENIKAAPMPSFIDLQEDGSAIIRGKELTPSKMVIYKDTGHWIGQYTGDPSHPFVFEHVYEGRKTIHHRWSLETVHTDGGIFHLFAGKNAFYAVNGAEPQEQETMMLCKELFFDNVLDRESAFAEINYVSEEYWLRFDSKREDINILMYSFRWDEASYSDYGYKAFTTARKETDIVKGVSQDHFLASAPDGSMRIYAAMDEPEPLLNDRRSFFGRGGRLTGSTTFDNFYDTGVLYLRASKDFFQPDDEGRFVFVSKDESSYSVATITKYHSPLYVETDTMILVDGEEVSGGVFDSYSIPVITDGYDAFAAKGSAEEDEIDMLGLTVIMGSKDRGAPVTVEMFAGKNPSDELLLTEKKLFERVIDNPRKNLIPMWFRNNYFQARISVINSLLDARLATKVYKIKRIIGSDRLTSGRR